MLRQGVGGDEKRWLAGPERLQCPLLAGKSHQILVWRNVKVLASHSVVHKHGTVQRRAPRRDQLSTTALCFVISWVSQTVPHKASTSLRFTNPVIHGKGFYLALTLIYLLSALSSGCHGSKLECHAGISPSPSLI